MVQSTMMYFEGSFDLSRYANIALTKLVSTDMITHARTSRRGLRNLMVLVAALSMCFSTVSGMRKGSPKADDVEMVSAEKGGAAKSNATNKSFAPVLAELGQTNKEQLEPAPKKKEMTVQEIIVLLEDAGYALMDSESIDGCYRNKQGDVTTPRAYALKNDYTIVTPMGFFEKHWKGIFAASTLVTTAGAIVATNSLKNMQDAQQEAMAEELAKIGIVQDGVFKLTEEAMAGELAETGVVQDGVLQLTEGQKGVVEEAIQAAEYAPGFQLVIMLGCGVVVLAGLLCMAHAIMAYAGIGGGAKTFGTVLMTMTAMCIAAGLCFVPSEMAANTTNVIEGLTEHTFSMQDLLLNPQNAFETALKEGDEHADELTSAYFLFAGGVLFFLFLIFVFVMDSKRNGWANFRHRSKAALYLTGGISTIIAGGISSHIITKMSGGEMVGSSSGHGPWMMFGFLCGFSLIGFITLTTLALGPNKGNFSWGLGVGYALATLAAGALSFGCLDMMNNTIPTIVAAGTSTLKTALNEVDPLANTEKEYFRGDIDGGVSGDALIWFVTAGVLVLGIMILWGMKNTCGKKWKFFNME